VALSKDGEKIYGFLSFDLSELPDMDRISITEAWIEIKNSSIIKRETNVRYNVEFIDLEEFSYQDIKNRERIEYIGYEISSMGAEKEEGDTVSYFDSLFRLFGHFEGEAERLEKGGRRFYNSPNYSRY